VIEANLNEALKKWRWCINQRGFSSATNILLALIGLLISAAPAAGGENTRDWITGLPREPIHVKAWPAGKKVAVCFILYVEVWGFGHGPNFRPDMVARDPDVVDESFRQYAIEWGIPRVGRLFNEQGMPLSIALNALFPENHPDLWKQFRSLVPKAPSAAASSARQCGSIVTGYIVTAAEGFSIKSFRPVGRKIVEASVPMQATPEPWAITKISEDVLEFSAVPQQSPRQQRAA
jgi:hypothetical protein